MGDSGFLARLGDRVRVLLSVIGVEIGLVVVLALIDPLFGGGVAKLLASMGVDTLSMMGAGIAASGILTALAWPLLLWHLYGTSLVQERLTIAKATAAHFGVHPTAVFDEQ